MRKLISSVICLSLILAGVAYAENLSAALDPLYLGVGARPLGMGRCFVGIAENAETLILNPAGLGNFDSSKITSMYSSLMGEANYFTFAGGIPINDAVAMGAGIVATSVNDIKLFSHSGSPEGTASYTNGVIFLSAGVNLEKDGLLSNLFPNKGKDLLLGASIKMFRQSSSGSELVSEVNGSGVNADIGVLYTPDSWLTLGVNFQNIIPPSMGSKITFADGVEEEIPLLIKFGSKIRVWGPEKALTESNNILDLALDVDLAKWGTAFHGGVEYQLEKWLTLRAGFDQDASPAGIASNPTFGVGFKHHDFSFDYAYHPYGDISENTTHFFSISYLGEEKPEIEVTEKPKERKPTLIARILDPENKSIVYSKTLRVKLELEGLGEKGHATVNGEDPRETRNGYLAYVPLEKPGKHLVTLKAANENDKIFESIKILRLLTFSDIKDDWARDPIESCATLGLVEGYPDGTFKPGRALSRAELATLLVRAQNLPLPNVTSAPFKDVPKSHWAAKYITAAKNEGLVKGYPDGTFRPNNKINRVEGIMVFSRSDGLEEVDADEVPFPDISIKHWAAGMIIAARDAGLLEYLEGKSLKPRAALTRAEAVEILSKTSLAKFDIFALRNFDIGFSENDETQPHAIMEFKL